MSPQLSFWGQVEKHYKEMNRVVPIIPDICANRHQNADTSVLANPCDNVNDTSKQVKLRESIKELGIACEVLILQVEKLADRAFSDEIEAWLKSNPAIIRAKKAMQKADKILHGEK